MGNPQIQLSADRAEPRLVGQVHMEFGEGCWLQVEAIGRAVAVRLHNPVVGVELHADGQLCTFQRAVNLLRLHLPEVAK